MIQPRNIEIQDFKDDLRFIVRKLRDMRADSNLLGFGAEDDLLKAQKGLISLLSLMKREGEAQHGKN